MCQKACFPAPKTVRVWTCVRRCRMMEAASAVRKAVSSSALMRPMGEPALSRRVRDPRGVVLWELAREGLGVGVLSVRAEEAEEVGVGGGSDSVMTFIPVLVPVVAGMKSVV